MVRFVSLVQVLNASVSIASGAARADSLINLSRWEIICEDVVDADNGMEDVEACADEHYRMHDM